MILNKELESYIENHTTPETELLKKINRTTHLKTFYPNMLSGHVQGMFLEMISRMIHPESILEIGTFTAYSAVALAQGLQNDGKLITIEIDEELEAVIREFIARSGLDRNIELMIGDALKIIPELESRFDLVFIDADKEQYVDYYEMVLPKVNPGGFILADNVLWSGKVLEDDRRSDKETMGIKKFNAHVRDDNRVEQVILSVRDGLMLIRKHQNL